MTRRPTANGASVTTFDLGCWSDPEQAVHAAEPTASRSSSSGDIPEHWPSAPSLVLDL
jgi:hypothetical protein